MVAQQETCPAKQQQNAAADHSQLRRGRAFALRVAGHHAGFGEVVECVHQEKAAYYDAPDQEEDVEQLDAVHGTTSFLCSRVEKLEDLRRLPPACSAAALSYSRAALLLTT